MDHCPVFFAVCPNKTLVELRSTTGATLIASVNGDPLIAATQAGKGRSLVWTSDIGPHWCPETFVKWEGFAPLMANMIAWVAGR